MKHKNWHYLSKKNLPRQLHFCNKLFALLNCSNKITIKKLKFHKKVQIIRKICKQVLMNTIKEKP